MAEKITYEEESALLSSPVHEGMSADIPADTVMTDVTDEKADPPKNDESSKANQAYSVRDKAYEERLAKRRQERRERRRREEEEEKRREERKRKDLERKKREEEEEKRTKDEMKRNVERTGKQFSLK